MGLDWNPLSRPKPGHEQEFANIVEMNVHELPPKEQQRIIARLQDISEAPFETLGAPRVGFDPEAEEWLASQLKLSGRRESLASARKRMHGFYVLDLLPPNPGLPVYTSQGYEGVDRYTFRGEFLKDVSGLLGEELFEAAYSLMTASELNVYGGRVLAVARAFAAKHGLERLEEQRDPPENDASSPEAHAHVLFSAARWCLWWSARGHGLEPYY